MAVRKICKLKGCRASPRCEHPWWFDVMYQGQRWRMRVDEFAVARGATEPITSKQTAERVWEPKLLGCIISGLDPRVPRRTPKAATELTVAQFLDRYWTTYVEAEGLRSARTIQGHLKALKASLGQQPVTVLEKPLEILRFKAEYRPGHEVATVNRVLGVLRSAINWGRFQDPPLLSTTPFHRFGVTIKSKEETKRDRRVGPQEEQALLAACSTMNSAEHKFVGPAMHDRIIGALETCCRQGETLRLQNRDVDWAQHQIVIRGANAEDAENRRLPFDPHGRLAQIPEIDFRTATVAGLTGLKDAEVLALAGRDSRVLITHDHSTIPRHFVEFIRATPSPGLIVVPQSLPVRDVVEALVLIWAATQATTTTAERPCRQAGARGTPRFASRIRALSERQHQAGSGVGGESSTAGWSSLGAPPHRGAVAAGDRDGAAGRRSIESVAPTTKAPSATTRGCGLEARSRLN
jgi:hypothetical protein